MDDKEIIELYFARDPNGILETDRKYGPLCRKVSYNILANHEDMEECVSDTYLAAWNSIPPQRPGVLKAYLLKIVRNFSLMRIRERASEKHGGGQIPLALEELGDIFPSKVSVEAAYEGKELAKAVSAFLKNLSEEDRAVFLCRYWHLASVRDISRKLGCTQSKVKTSLFRTRKKLLAYLTKEDLV